MKQIQEALSRFLVGLFSCLIFIGISFVIRGPQGDPPPEFAHFLLQALFVGALMAASLIYFTRNIKDEVFSRRMVASVMITFLIFLMFDHFFSMFDHFISEHLLRIGNPILSGMLAFWAIMIAVNVASQALHKLSPSNFR
jgi:drug/metabolite transporter (DMT)-like permease